MLRLWEREASGALTAVGLSLQAGGWSHALQNRITAQIHSFLNVLENPSETLGLNWVATVSPPA